MEAGHVMRIGLIGDTHDRLPAIAELVGQMIKGGAGMILHVGDYCSPFSLRAFEDAQVSLAGIFGKNDGDHQGLVSRAQSAFGSELFESPHSFEISGRRILLVHDIADVQDHPRTTLRHLGDQLGDRRKPIVRVAYQSNPHHVPRFHSGFAISCRMRSSYVSRAVTTA